MTENVKRVLGVITARGGSKGIPRKNIKFLGGRPLIVWTIECAKQSKCITHLIVSTDDEEIADVCRRFGAEVPFLRPKELAADTTTHVLVMQHATRFMEDKLGIRIDYVVILQPTSPFRKVEYIDGTIRKIIETQADSAVTVVKVTKDHPLKFKILDGDRVLPYILEEPQEGMRRQDWPVVYKRSSDVYVMRRDLLMKEGKLYGPLTVGYVVDEESHLDINDWADWVYAEYLYEKFYAVK